MAKMAVFNCALIFVIGYFASVQAGCDRKYSSVSAGHTACKPYNTALSQRGVPKAQQNEIVDLHNELRGDLKKYNQPEATNMMKIYWDDEIAMIAQRQADSCVYKHDDNHERSIPGRLTLGQNIALGHGNWRDVILDWHYEYNVYDYWTNSKKGSTYVDRYKNRVAAQIGHYTQIVWATTARIGCGYAKCGAGVGNHYVCNYGPAGNGPHKRGVTPYKTGGKTAADCPNTKKNGVCDCGKDKLCLNLGTLDPNTCKCKCLRPYHRGTDCGLMCNKAKDFGQCGTQIRKEQCKISNVPVEYCPHMCNQCPYGDIKYQPEGGKSVPSQPRPNVKTNPTPPKPPVGGNNGGNNGGSGAAVTTSSGCKKPYGFWTEGQLHYYCSFGKKKLGCAVRVDGAEKLMKQGKMAFGKTVCKCAPYFSSCTAPIAPSKGCKKPRGFWKDYKYNIWFYCDNGRPIEACLVDANGRKYLIRHGEVTIGATKCSCYEGGHYCSTLYGKK